MWLLESCMYIIFFGTVPQFSKLRKEALLCADCKTIITEEILSSAFESCVVAAKNFVGCKNKIGN